MKYKKGFSLIELMVVVSLVLILASITIANFSYFQRNIIHLEINKLYAACMYAQRCAMVTNKPQKLKFDRVRRLYTINNRTEKLSKDIEFGFMAGSKGPPSAPSRVITSPITFKNDEITFNPNGIIQPGSVYVVDSKKQCMYALSSPISQVSFLRKYRYDKKWGLIK
jgi:prepilin-type N-terminal cleavage/methylation domain-containing protein